MGSSPQLGALRAASRAVIALSLGHALLGWDASRLSRVQACAGEGALGAILAKGSDLPWLDGVAYLEQHT